MRLFPFKPFGCLYLAYTEYIRAVEEWWAKILGFWAHPIFLAQYWAILGGSHPIPNICLAPCVPHFTICSHFRVAFLLFLLPFSGFASILGIGFLGPPNILGGSHPIFDIGGCHRILHTLAARSAHYTAKREGAAKLWPRSMCLPPQGRSYLLTLYKFNPKPFKEMGRRLAEARGRSFCLAERILSPEIHRF